MDAAYLVSVVFGLFLFLAAGIYIFVFLDKHIIKKFSNSKHSLLYSISLFLGSFSMVVAYIEYLFFITPTSEDLYPITYLFIAFLLMFGAIFLYNESRKELIEELECKENEME